MIGLGSEFPGLPPFIGSGYRTHIPHVQWTAKVVQTGDNVPIELTGVTQRYAGPIFRILSVGKASSKMKSDFQVVKDQLEAAIAAIKPGVTSARSIPLQRKQPLSVGAFNPLRKERSSSSLRRSISSASSFPGSS